MNKIQKISLSETVGGKDISIQTGTLAKQAGGSVTIHLGDTVVLTTATVAKNPKPVNFIPLTVEYRERTYAAGKIPGGFFKRENRPRDKEVLNARMTDRPIRPLFPDGWNRETMVYSLIVSMDGQNDAGPLSITAGSCALMLSEAPFAGPVAGVRVGRLDGKLVLFPTFEEREKLDLEMIVAGKKDAILMVEGGMAQVPEEVILEALELAQKEINKLCDLQLRLVAETEKAGRKIVKAVVTPPSYPEPVNSFVTERALPEVKKALAAGYKHKHGMSEHLKPVQDALKAEILEKAKTDPAWVGQDQFVGSIVHDLEGVEGRKLIVNQRVRHDGRKLDEVRPIDILTPALPCAHGSVVFTRGETQALAVTTLGTPGDMQVMDELEGEYKDRFMLHYNFPGYSVGEVKPERGPGRREIGHGTLAKRALVSLLPPEEEFAYTIRIVSDILESNGSSSMASVCGGSLSMFDAGVPLKAACAGVAMGLIMEDGKYAILTDIAGLEDHVGDMDFKVAGTRTGVTALQMDIKVEGISIAIMKEALAQAKAGRFHILDKMDAVMPSPRAELSPHAPRLIRITIPVDKIGALIGPGGKNIRRIIEEYGVEVEVEDDGSVFIAGVDAVAVAQARAEVEGMTAEAEIGKIYKGRVVSCVEFGAFVEIMPGKEGLLHISQIDVNRVARVTDVLKEGQEVEVKVLEVSKEGKIRLSRKAVIAPGSENDGSDPGPRRDGGGRGGDRNRGGGGRERRERAFR
ncbi:MAG TPA: polyribonucleotide nucleotidyltransferase [Elusimicrobiota bacterium]|jgi:polyribonucleotide nucleotidyltransferase|nr:polyribonucleotide nucleotidyltransferase [Elusimicrobiota bacterium]